MTATNGLLLAFLAAPVASAAGAYVFFIHSKQHQQRTHRAVRLIAGNALVLLLVMSPAVAAGEIYYRFCFDSTDAFGMTRVNQDWLARYYHRNNVNLRDSVDYALKLQPGVRRLTFIGDSFTAGHGIKDVEQRFVNRVRRALGDWDVQCHAINGLDSLYQLRHIEQLIAGGYQFGLTVLVYVPNDIMQTIPSQDHPVEQVRAAADPPWIARHSYLFNTWYYRWYLSRHEATASYYTFLPKLYEGAAWQTQQALLARMQREIESHDGRLIVVTFPFLHELGPDSPFRGVHEKLAAFWKERNVPYLDLLPIFEAHGDEDLIVSRRDPHPNELAHQLAAEAVTAFIREQIDE